MAAFIPVPNCLEVAMFFDWLGHETVCAFTYDIGTSPDASDLEGYAQTFATTVWGNWQPWLSDDISFLRATATDVTTQNGSQDINTSNTLETGDVGGGSVGNNTSAIISWRTALRGRSYRGRTYVPGLPLTALETPNTIGSIAAGQLADSFLSLIFVTPVIGNSGSLVVVSRRANGTPRSTAVTTPVTGRLVRTEVGTQRRRLKNVNT